MVEQFTRIRQCTQILLKHQLYNLLRYKKANEKNVPVLDPAFLNRSRPFVVSLCCFNSGIMIDKIVWR